MTKEEAAEIILGGVPFETCPTCNGDGFVGDPSGEWCSRESCSKCLPEADTKAGSGKVLKPLYAEAYATLGLEPPPARWSDPMPISKILEENSMKNLEGVENRTFKIIIEDEKK